jgi:hypothetical protein
VRDQSIARPSPTQDSRDIGRSPWVRDQSIARPSPTQNSRDIGRMHTAMLEVGFEPTITMLERTKVFRVLDRTALRTADLVIFIGGISRSVF